MGMSDQASEPVRVEICDQTYSLRSHGGAEHVRRIARIVDERMRRISSRLTVHDVARIAVLTALNIADEFFRARDAQQDEAESITTRAEALERMVDQALQLAGSDA